MCRPVKTPTSAVTPARMTMEIGEGPYYLVEQEAPLCHHHGGLVVNTTLEVETPTAK